MARALGFFFVPPVAAAAAFHGASAFLARSRSVPLLILFWPFNCLANPPEGRKSRWHDRGAGEKKRWDGCDDDHIHFGRAVSCVFVSWPTACSSSPLLSSLFFFLSSSVRPALCQEGQASSLNGANHFHPAEKEGNISSQRLLSLTLKIGRLSLCLFLCCPAAVERAGSQQGNQVCRQPYHNHPC